MIKTSEMSAIVLVSSSDVLIENKTEVTHNVHKEILESLIPKSIAWHICNYIINKDEGTPNEYKILAENFLNHYRKLKERRKKEGKK